MSPRSIAPGRSAPRPPFPFPSFSPVSGKAGKPGYTNSWVLVSPPAWLAWAVLFRVNPSTILPQNCMSCMSRVE